MSEHEKKREEAFSLAIEHGVSSYFHEIWPAYSDCVMDGIRKIKENLRRQAEEDERFRLITPNDWPRGIAR